jgi:hypothetical protein
MAVAGDNPSFITPPPGLIPAARPQQEVSAETDSATHRISPPAQIAAPVPAFFPAPIGVPPTAQHGSPPAIVLPDGARHPLSVSLLVGRNPANSAEWPSAGLLPVADPAKTVSKTHAAIEVTGHELWAHDLSSTNGVSVERATGEVVRVVPGERVAVVRGDLLTLGDFPIRIE